MCCNLNNYNYFTIRDGNIKLLYEPTFLQINQSIKISIKRLRFSSLHQFNLSVQVIFEMAKFALVLFFLVAAFACTTDAQMKATTKITTKLPTTTKTTTKQITTRKITTKMASNVKCVPLVPGKTKQQMKMDRRAMRAAKRAARAAKRLRREREMKAKTTSKKTTPKATTKKTTKKV
jgi:hypothetical protein